MIFTNDMECFIKRIKNQYSPLQQWAFIAVMLVGLVAHGYIIFNRISYHDNTACLFSLGATYELGRWGLGIIRDLQIYTTRTFAVPVFNGFLSMTFIAFAAMKIVDIFDIKSRVSAFAIGTIMIVYPTVPSIFSFMFTSWPYFLGLLLSVQAADVLVANRNNFLGANSKTKVVVSAILLALSLSLYQAFFAVTISVFLIILLQDVIIGNTQSVKSYAKQGFTYLMALGIGLCSWAGVAALFKKIKHIDTMDYKGMGEGYDLGKLPTQLVYTIKEFFGASYAGVNGLKYLCLLTMMVIFVAIIHIVVLIRRSDVSIGVKISAFIGVLFLPVGMNVMYILSTSEEYFVDSLMVYGTAFVLILPIVLIEYLNANDGVFIKLITWIQIIAIAVISISYIYLDNAAYMKAEIAEKQAESYFTQLAANIKNCDGFKDDKEIVFVDFDSNTDGTFVNVDDEDEFAAIKIEKFPTYQELVTYGSAINFMQEHCGFGNDLVHMDDGTVAELPEVKAMPCYPDDGSIVAMGEKIVVKFGK